MKKILAVLTIVCALALSLVWAANETYTGVSYTVRHTPADISGYVLYDRGDAAASKDTFATTVARVFGPYPLTKADNGPMAKSFTVMADVIDGTTPTMSFGYQILSGKEIADTSVWTEACTLGTTALNSSFDISSKAGESILFRIDNYDGTSCFINNLVKVYIKENYTWSKDR